MQTQRYYWYINFRSTSKRCLRLILGMPAMTSSQCAAAMLCFGVVECNVLPIICVAMRHFFGIAGVAADNVTNSSAARPAQHPIILRQYSAGDAFSQCLSTHAVDAFFQQCSATELTGPDVDLLNSLLSNFKFPLSNFDFQFFDNSNDRGTELQKPRGTLGSRAGGTLPGGPWHQPFKKLSKNPF